MLRLGFREYRKEARSKILWDIAEYILVENY